MIDEILTEILVHVLDRIATEYIDISNALERGRVRVVGRNSKKSDRRNSQSESACSSLLNNPLAPSLRVMWSALSTRETMEPMRVERDSKGIERESKRIDN